MNVLFIALDDLGYDFFLTHVDLVQLINFRLENVCVVILIFYFYELLVQEKNLLLHLFKFVSEVSILISELVG